MFAGRCAAGRRRHGAASLPHWCAAAHATSSATATRVQLLISPKTPPQLKLRDRQSDRRIAGLFEAQIGSLFALPSRPDRTGIFFRAVEIADLMFSLSMLEHGSITPAMTEEAVRAVTGYLLRHFPAKLPAAAICRRASSR